VTLGLHLEPSHPFILVPISNQACNNRKIAFFLLKAFYSQLYLLDENLLHFGDSASLTGKEIVKVVIVTAQI